MSSIAASRRNDTIPTPSLVPPTTVAHQTPGVDPHADVEETIGATFADGAASAGIYERQAPSDRSNVTRHHPHHVALNAPSLDAVAQGKTMKLGMRGPAVGELQELLNAAGAKPPLAVDGAFGPRTEAALKRFQHQAGLHEDKPGTLGAASLAGLHDALAASGIDDMCIGTPAEVEHGSRVGQTPSGADVTNAVSAARWRLTMMGVATDGAAGKLTPKVAAALRDVQRAAGLPETGVPDAATLHALDRAADAHDGHGPYTDRREEALKGFEKHVQAPPNAQNAAIVSAMRDYVGRSTAHGPDGGNLACAWSVNQILTAAGIPKVGENPMLVSSVEAELKNGRAERVPLSEARAGDLVIFPGHGHIGIATGDGNVFSNGSSAANFSLFQELEAGATIYRLKEPAVAE